MCSRPSCTLWLLSFPNTFCIAWVKSGDKLLFRHEHPSQDLAAVNLSVLHLATSGSHHSPQLLFLNNNETIRQKHSHIGHSLPSLISYTKILKIITTALTKTELWRGKADNVSDQLVPYKVWTYDGNFEYLKGQHVALFAVALLLLVLLFLPYTLLLLFGQFVRSMPVRRRRGVQWIPSTAFISILDAYHAPYNNRYRYWTGLMLLTRCFLILAFVTNNSENAFLTNMYAIALAMIAILTLKTCATKIYKHFYVGILELSFFLNLEVLSSTLYYLKGYRKWQHMQNCNNFAYF